jgi:acyl-CoA dehydrogenase
MDTQEPLILTEELRMVQKSARELFDSVAPLSEFRRLRDAQDERAYVPELWSRMAELGWPAMLIPEKYEGIDFGFGGLGVVMSEAGRSLSASPLLMSGVVGACTLLRCAPESIKTEILPKIASGENTITLAIEEGDRHQPYEIGMMSASGKSDAYSLSGEKRFVLDGGFADHIVVSAQLEKELALFLVNGTAKGVKREPLQTIDHRNTVHLSLKNAPARLLARAEPAKAALGYALDAGRVAIAAEMLGGAWECFDRTVAYLKEREQFGVKIGSFQALQHRAAQIYVLLELTRSVVLDASAKVEESWNSTDKEVLRQMAMAAAHAKTTANDCYLKAASEGIQMHGGIGMTDEFDIGFFIKRMQVATQSFGDSNFLRTRYADLAGI